MNVWIIEDEKPASERLSGLLKKLDEEINISQILDSVKRSVKAFESSSLPDLVFMDIQLGDGSSFEIFEKVQIEIPVIFTTAYNDYAIKAFKVNSIDYLLKPIDQDELKASLDKFKKLNAQDYKLNSKSPSVAMLEKAIQMISRQYKSRFVVKIGEFIYTVLVSEISYFCSQQKATYLNQKEGNKYIIDYSLDQLEQLIDPQQFFRINRQYIINIDGIKELINYSNSRLKVKLKSSTDDKIIVSREKVGEFKDWLDR